jgi:hypothetical protein
MAYTLHETRTLHLRDRFHGWAAARANLDDPENKEEFANLYARVSTFIKGAR